MRGEMLTGVKKTRWWRGGRKWHTGSLLVLHLVGEGGKVRKGKGEVGELLIAGEGERAVGDFEGGLKPRDGAVQRSRWARVEGAHAEERGARGGGPGTRVAQR